MQALLISLSGIISVVSIAPYIKEIVRGRVKPRLVSWFTWFLLSVIASFASWSDGAVGAGVQTAASALSILGVLALGWKLGDKRFDRVDAVCLTGVLAGLVLWQVFDSPALAVLSVIAIDLVGCIPTLIHSWKKPYEEAWVTFLLGGVGAAFVLPAATDWAVTAVGYQLYVVAVNVLMTGLILLSPYRKLKGEPAELREL